MPSKQKFKITRELTAEDKMSPQARVIAETVIEAVGVGEQIDRDDLVARLTESGKLNTRQEPGRVVAYYIPRLKEDGLLEVEVEAAAAPADGEEKPKRTRKSKAAAAEGPTEVGADATQDTAADAASTDVAV